MVRAAASKTQRILVTGAGGRMGRVLVAAVASSGDLRLTAATEREGSPLIGQDAGTVAGVPSADVAISSDIVAALAKADVVIDFTSPEASLEHAVACSAAKKPLIVGSTGFAPATRAALEGHARKIPIVFAPNMSVGVNVLFKLAGDVARILGDQYDAEIIETHHRMKKDAPSGTALRLAEVVAESLGLNPQRDIVKSRDGQIGERPRKTIGVQTLRGGDVVGDHTVLFLGEGERLELTHRATSRANFAQGALRAARWIIGKPPGLYDMQDVLGLRTGESS